MPKPIIKGGEYNLFISNCAMRDIYLKYRTVSDVLSDSDIEIIKSIMKESYRRVPKNLTIIDNELTIFNPLKFNIIRITSTNITYALSFSLIVDIRVDGTPMTRSRLVVIYMFWNASTDNFEINVGTQKIVNSDE